MRRDWPLDARGGREGRKARTKLSVPVMDEKLGTLSLGSCFPQLLGGPIIGWVSGRRMMDDAPTLQLDDNEDPDSTSPKQGRKDGN